MDDLFDVLNPGQTKKPYLSLEQLEMKMLKSRGKSPRSAAKSSNKDDERVAPQDQASQPTTRTSTSRGSNDSDVPPSSRASPVPLFEPIPEDEAYIITDEVSLRVDRKDRMN